MAKNLILSNSALRRVTLACMVDGDGLITDLLVRTLGVVKDEDGNEVKEITTETWIGDLSSGLRSDLNGLMREISEEFNNHVASEPSSTWLDL